MAIRIATNPKNTIFLFKVLLWQAFILNCHSAFGCGQTDLSLKSSIVKFSSYYTTDLTNEAIHQKYPIAQQFQIEINVTCLSIQVDTNGFEITMLLFPNASDSNGNIYISSPQQISIYVQCPNCTDLTTTFTDLDATVQLFPYTNIDILQQTFDSIGSYSYASYDYRLFWNVTIDNYCRVSGLFDTITGTFKFHSPYGQNDDTDHMFTLIQWIVAGVCIMAFSIFIKCTIELIAKYHSYCFKCVSYLKKCVSFLCCIHNNRHSIDQSNRKARKKSNRTTTEDGLENATHDTQMNNTNIMTTGSANSVHTGKEVQKRNKKTSKPPINRHNESDMTRLRRDSRSDFDQESQDATPTIKHRGTDSNRIDKYENIDTSTIIQSGSKNQIRIDDQETDMKIDTRSKQESPKRDQSKSEPEGRLKEHNAMRKMMPSAKQEFVNESTKLAKRKDTAGNVNKTEKLSPRKEHVSNNDNEEETEDYVDTTAKDEKKPRVSKESNA